MMGIFAFFPWLTIEAPHQCGDLWLLPYKRGSAPGGAGTTAPKVMDTITGCYWRGREHRIDDAVVVAHDREQLLKQLSNDEMDTVFELAELLAVAGLAERALFTQGRPYCNRDQFRVVVQGFAHDEVRGVTQTVRRRDGHTLSAWGIDLFRVERPDHIQAPWRINTESTFLAALLTARSVGKLSNYWEAIVSFNQANTDAPTVTPAAEAVFLMSSFERLLDACPNDKAMLAGFNRLFAPSSRIAKSDCQRLTNGTKEFKKAQSVGQAWLLDFWHLRGDLAHGHNADNARAVWSLAEHLLLGSFLFPLLLKRRLEADGLYAASDDDQDLLEAFEHLAAADDLLAGKTDSDGMRDFDWNRIISEVRRRGQLERVFGALEPEPPGDA